MRYSFEIKDERDRESWREEYDVPSGSDPKEWVEDVLSRFNSDLRPHETKRTMLSFELVGEPKNHTWSKISLTPVQHSGRFFDRYECTRCHITGKRYGIRGIKTDSKFKAEVYRQCDTSVAHQKIKEERKRRKEEGDHDE